jgi:hypothetical protein
LNTTVGVIQPPNDYACMHVEDVAAVLKEKCLDARPSGK